jgi:hypothetical protein
VLLNAYTAFCLQNPLSNQLRRFTPSSAVAESGIDAALQTVFGFKARSPLWHHGSRSTLTMEELRYDLSVLLLYVMERSSSIYTSLDLKVDHTG